MGSKKMKSPSPSRLLFLLVCLLSSFHRAPAASASESPEGERGASETRKSTRRYVQSDDSHSLWFAGLRSGLEHRDPSGGGDVGGFVLTYFLGDNRREGGNETYRLSVPGRDNGFFWVEPERLQLRPGQVARLKMNVYKEKHWRPTQTFRFTIKAERLSTGANISEGGEVSRLETILVPHEFTSPAVTPSGVVAVDRRRAKDQTSPAANARVEPDGCGRSGGGRWSALFWVWDAGAGLNRVRVGAARDPKSGRQPSRTERDAVFYRHLPYPVGTNSRFLVNSSAPCSVGALALEAWDVRENRLEVVAARDKHANGGGGGCGGGRLFLTVCLILLAALLS